MTSPAILLAILIVAGPPDAEAPETRRESILDWLARGSTRAELDRLFAHAHFGLAPWETAAWVVRAPGAGVSLRPWAFTGATARAVWHGPVPPGAVAIIHTHPSTADPRPSGADADLARRLVLPVFTLSREGLWVAEPDGEIRREASAPGACVLVACLR